MNGRLRPFFRPDVARDVDEELRSHLELYEEDLVARGMSRAEARALAVRRFGDVGAIAHACRRIDEQWYGEQRRASMWRDLRQDVGYALRLVRRAPGFTALAVVTLALGIGGSAAIFSIIDAALLRPLPYPKPEQLVEVLIDEWQRDGRTVRVGPSKEEVETWRAAGDLFSHVAVWRRIFRPAVVDGPELERLGGLEISEDYLPLHGVAPVAGRGFTAEDMQPGAPAVVMLGHAYWQTRFGGDRGVVGRTLRIDNEPATVVGVLPASFYRETPIWRPLRLPSFMHGRRGMGTTTYARLREGVSIEYARQRLTDVTRARDLAAGHTPPQGIAINSLYARETFGYRDTTDILAAAVGAILLIACINVAGLLLARGATRRGELGIRASLGASRARLVRQLLAESLVLALLGAAAGLLLAWVSLDLLVANIPMNLPANSPPALDLRVLGFTTALAAVTGLLFGLAPAWSLSRVNLAGTLARTSERFGSSLPRRGGQVLIAAEIAICIVLLAGAGLMIRSFARMLSVDVGFDPRAVVTMEVTPVDQSGPVLRQYYPALVESLQHLPGVAAAGAVDHLPLAGSSTMVIGNVEGRRMPINVRQFVPGYFEAIGFTLRQGRFPSRADASAGVPLAVVNEQAASQMFGGEPALGRRFEVGKDMFEVAGVVGDLRHRGPLDPPMPEVFLPFGSRDAERMIAVVRSTAGSGAASLHTQLRQAALGVGPRVIVTRIRSGSDWFADRVVTPRQRTVLLSILGGLGFVLALVGIFGMTAYAVSRRTQEIGIRMALGAHARQVVRETVRDSFWPVVLGIAVGLAGAAAATRVIASFLFDTRPIDPVTFAVVAVAVAVAAGLAAWIPARRAARVDPVTALRVTA
ncbi:MAG TPA: ABC transporter permease [Vicinamibacterales bacterium]|nr:ABC transporter permease [Vicinamibacterales bacterium]